MWYLLSLVMVQCLFLLSLCDQKCVMVTTIDVYVLLAVGKQPAPSSATQAGTLNPMSNIWLLSRARV